MDKIKFLERKYNDFIREKKNYPFFRGLGKYVEYLIENDEFKPLIKEIKAHKTRDHAKLKRLEKQSVAEHKKTKNRILQITKKEKLKSEKLKQGLKKLADFEKGLWTSSRKDPEVYHDCLFDIVRAVLPEKVRFKAFKEFLSETINQKNIFGDFIFSKSYAEYQNEREAIKNREREKVWGAWDKVYSVFLIFAKQEEVEKDLLKEKDTLKRASYSIYKAEKDKMLEEFEDSHKGTRAYNDYVLFEIDKYRLYAKELNDYILDQLHNRQEEVKQSDPKKKGKKSLSFDMIRGVEINGKTAKIKSPKYRAILEAIFKDKISKTWEFNELAESIDRVTADNYKEKNFYNQFYNLNRTIKDQTGIQSFLEFNKTSERVRINPKYLCKKT